VPRRFRLGARVVEAAGILDRWPAGTTSTSSCAGRTGPTYILRQDLDRGDWRLVLFRDPHAPGGARLILALGGRGIGPSGRAF
jgi:hypothetical protein